jgi:hypothetical protein
MKLKVISEHNDNMYHGTDYMYSIKYYYVKFLGEIIEVCKEDIPFIEIMQFWLERKASRNCHIWYTKTHCAKFNWLSIKAHFWSRLEVLWGKLYNCHRNKKPVYTLFTEWINRICYEMINKVTAYYLKGGK